MTRLKKIPRQALSEEVYQELLEAIVSGKLAPGERIRDQDLALELGVSRTPVREAIRRLRDEGLVESISGVSTRVAPLDPRVLTEAIPVLSTLHALAARLGVPRLNEADLSAMRNANRSFRSAIKNGTTSLAIGADDDFHSVLVNASGNREIIRALQRLTPAARRIGYDMFVSVNGEESSKQHESIIEACEVGDVELTARLVEGNWMSIQNLYDFHRLSDE